MEDHPLPRWPLAPEPGQSLVGSPGSGAGHQSAPRPEALASGLTYQNPWKAAIECLRYKEAWRKWVGWVRPISLNEAGYEWSVGVLL